MAGVLLYCGSVGGGGRSRGTHPLQYETQGGERSVKITSSHHKLSCDCLQVEALPARAVELLGVESRLYCFEHWGTDQVL